MTPRIVISQKKQLIGKKLLMSFAENKTYELWKNFMPHRKEITNFINNDLISLEVYPQNFFDNFNTNTLFEKWAAIEVIDYSIIPDEMESIIIPEGLYAVFIHYGLSSKAAIIYEYIFKEWLPDSDYKIDERPHFAVMGSKYKNEDINSEEEIWIPIKIKE